MFLNYNDKNRKLLTFFLLFGTVLFFSYCTSSTKVASSFSKRKYTRGHFSEPVARLKMEPLPAENSVEGNTPSLPREAGKTDASGIAAPAAKKPVDAPYSIAASSSSKSIANQSNISENNASLKEGEQNMPDHPYGEEHGGGYEHHGANPNSYLMGWIICLGISLICYAILIGGTGAAFSGSAEGAGCLLIGLGSFAFIAAIVLFIFWIIALAKT